jgi:hypothetical protein
MNERRPAPVPPPRGDSVPAAPVEREERPPSPAPPPRLGGLQALEGIEGIEPGAVCDVDDPDCAAQGG